MYNAEFTVGSQKLGNAQISRGIFQGVSLSLLLFIIAVISGTLIFREVKNLITKKKLRNFINFIYGRPWNFLPKVKISRKAWCLRFFRNICDALCDLVPFVQFKNREKHPWMSVTLLKVTLLHGCF